ncbi:MAG: GNAT family N-acetyltransferase [Firmicutes bacterium]|nr:GNAT family N-acetyltransferase [Bacillota bacterium]
MYVGVSKSIKIRELQINDVYGMLNWGKHDSPLFEDYNFPKLNDNEIELWYKMKTKKKNKKCFAIITDNNNIIGYLTIRKIKRFRKKATLGIVFDPNFMNKGYGTEALNVFLDYFFNILNMNQMILEVAKFNKRALKCYKKCGFNKYKKYNKKIENQDIDIFGDDYYKDIRDCFIIKNGYTQTVYYKMRIYSEEFNQRKHKHNKNVNTTVDMWKSS